MKFNESDIVEHKLTKEKFLVLSQDGFGVSSGPKRLRLRSTNLQEIWLDSSEVILVTTKGEIK